MASMEQMLAEAVAERVRTDLETVRTELADLKRQLASGPQPERPMSRRQTAEWLGCSVRTVDNMLADGAPHFRPGGPGGSPRLLASELLAWMRGRSAA